MKTRVSAVLAFLLLPACRASGDDARPPHVFHPDSVSVGDTVAGLRIEAMDVSRGTDNEPVGSVRFAGETRVSGQYQPHPGGEAETLCFFADAASAPRLPRFPHDARREWLCFENSDEARVMLRVPPDSGQAEIAIDRYTYHFAHTDAANQARLVQVLTHAVDP